MSLSALAVVAESQLSIAIGKEDPASARGCGRVDGCRRCAPRQQRCAVGRSWEGSSERLPRGGTPPMEAKRAQGSLHEDALDVTAERKPRTHEGGVGLPLSPVARPGADVYEG